MHPIRLKRSIAISFLLVFLTVVAARASENRLDANVAPTFQSIRLNLDSESIDYWGAVDIELEVEETTKTFRLHGEGMDIEEISLVGESGPVPVKVKAGEHGLLQVTAGKEIPPGAYSLHIEFWQDYNTKAVGLYRMTKEDKGYLFTQFEAVDARKAFPCWDEPIYKIPFQFTIRLPSGQAVLTNTPVESEETDSEGQRTVVFKRTKPLPTYLLAIAAGPLESVPITGLSVPGRIYVPEGQSHLASLAVEVTPAILAKLEEYFDLAYPYEKLDFIAIPEYWSGAMENAGAVTFRDDVLLIDPAEATVSQKRRLALIVAHELAHMWFGDLVTMSWWDDLWLNESFADWLAEKVIEEMYPQYEVGIAELQGVQGLLSSDARPSTKPVRKPVDSPADIMEDIGLAYGKGKTVLRMIENWIGAEDFREGVLAYIDEHAWGNTVAQDLWSALEASSGKSIEPVLASFLDQSGYPLVEMELIPSGTLLVTQRRFLNHGVEAEPRTWTIPIRIKYSDGQDVQVKTILLDGTRAEVKLDGRVAWFHPDEGAYGYYRWKIPSDVMLLLAEKPEAYLTPRERVGFVGNIAALLDAGMVGGDEYLRVLSSFAQKPEPEVINALVSQLGELEMAFVPDDLRPEFAYYVRSSLRPSLDTFGFEKRVGEAETITLLRPRLIAWLGKQGEDEEVREYARRIAEQYLNDPSSCDASLAGVSLRLAALEGGREQFEAYKKGFLEAQVPSVRRRYLTALGAFENPELQREAMKMAISPDVRANEMFNILGGIMDSAEGRDLVFNWLMENYTVVTSRIPAEFAAYMPYLASGCSNDRLEAAKEFFSKPENQVDGTENMLAKVADQVNDCVNLRNRESAAIRAFLKELARAQ